MYGLFTYIRWKTATFKGKVNIPYMDHLGEKQIVYSYTQNPKKSKLLNI